MTKSMQNYPLGHRDQSSLRICHLGKDLKIKYKLFTKSLDYVKFMKLLLCTNHVLSKGQRQTDTHTGWQADRQVDRFCCLSSKPSEHWSDALTT